MPTSRGKEDLNQWQGFPSSEMLLFLPSHFLHLWLVTFLALCSHSLYKKLLVEGGKEGKNEQLFGLSW